MFNKDTLHERLDTESDYATFGKQYVPWTVRTKRKMWAQTDVMQLKRLGSHVFALLRHRIKEEGFFQSWNWVDSCTTGLFLSSLENFFYSFKGGWWWILNVEHTICLSVLACRVHNQLVCCWRINKQKKKP